MKRIGLTFVCLLAAAAPKKPGPVFQASDRCVACHNGLSASSGEDYSFGFDWRATMMANASRDPYWHAGVRREVLEHPEAKALIEDECSTCHMPMMRYEAKLAGKEGEVFAHLPFDPGSRAGKLAADGVSCSLCHQISKEKLGTKESFVGGFVIGQPDTEGNRAEYGPFKIEAGLTRVMRTSSRGYRPIEAPHIRQSEMCATCHTLITKALGPGGKIIGELSEQNMYGEWLHSGYRDARSCQSCHMPRMKEDVRITNVQGDPRPGVSRHIFLGGNFFMLRLLSQFRGELQVEALPQELDAAAERTIVHLANDTARVSVANAQVRAGLLEAQIRVENLGGHKLPTAYPSRRVWLHVTVRDRAGRAVFESGAINPKGMIDGNDNDLDATRFEPHYAEIREPGQVQIYESIMGASDGRPTTGLLAAIGYLKDNRLLPAGFDKRTAPKEVAVLGGALDDADFGGGSDQVRYSVAVQDSAGPFQIEVELRFQPIAYRWAENLRLIDSMESKRFARYYDTMSASASTVVARASARAQ